MRKGIFKNPLRRWFWLFLGPVTAAFAIGFVWPFIQGIYLSFCKFKLIRNATFIGFGNYVSALKDASFMHSFWYTALFALTSLVFINILGFAAAYALTQGIKGSNLYRTVFFMPNLIGGIVLGYIWSTIFEGILIHFDTSLVLESKFGFWGLVILQVLISLAFGVTAPLTWSPNQDRNFTFLRQVQSYLNDKFHAQGHLFMNEALDELGMERTQAGALVGWVVGSDGDGFVDLGFTEYYTDEYCDIHGLKSIHLNMNVDGVIYDKI